MSEVNLQQGLFNSTLAVCSKLILFSFSHSEPYEMNSIVTHAKKDARTGHIYYRKCIWCIGVRGGSRGRAIRAKAPPPPLFENNLAHA